jgi:hypothetical protein
MSDIKCVVTEISPVLAKLVNLSVKHHKFPNKLKEAIVRPIYKKGDRKSFSNYRPIAILSSVDKIMEKCVINQLSTFFIKHDVLNPSQHGFQQGKSTTTLLSKFTDEVNSYLNDKKIVLAVFFDFKKAFDTLESSTLLKAMNECGVSEPLNEWFRDYLTSRSFKVRVGSTYSRECAVECGVPQGSGCGPVCYLMHVNSLCGVLQHCSAHMFADDLCALRAGTDLEDTFRLVQQDIDAVVKWSHDNGIVLNADKTKFLLIRSPYLPFKNIHPHLHAHTYPCLHKNMSDCICHPIEKVKCITYLGMKVDEHLSWSHHVNFIYEKLRVLLGKFYHLRFKVPISTLRCLYMSLVDSILGYALDSYGLTTKSNIDKLEAMQIRFLKLLVNDKTKLKCKDNYRQLFKICKILPVSLKHKYILATNNHSCLEPNSVYSSLLKPIHHAHNTKSMATGKLFVPRINNYYGDRTLKKRIPYLLNSLPEAIRCERNKNKFKRLLRKHYLDSG